MRLFKSLILSVVVVSCVPCASLQGQLVQIFNNGRGGVNIRAPFVRIDTDRFGNTHVRAPFVNINTPPPAYYQPPYYVPAAPYGSYRVPNQPMYANPVPGTTIVQPPTNQFQTAPSTAPRQRGFRRNQRFTNQTNQTNGAQQNRAAPSKQPAESQNKASPSKAPAESPATTPHLKSVLDRQLSPVKPEELPVPRPNDPVKK